MLPPVLKNSRHSMTRMNKKRIKLHYEEGIKTIDPDFFPTKRAKTTKRQHRRSKTNERTSTDAHTADIGKCCNLPADRTVIHQSSKIFSGYRFEIEISKSDKLMYIAAVNSSKPTENYLIELDVNRAEEIFKEFNDNYFLIVTNLEIISKRLALLNPKLKGKKKSESQKKCAKKNIAKRSNRTISQPNIHSFSNDENQNVNQKAENDLKVEEDNPKEVKADAS